MTLFLILLAIILLILAAIFGITAYAHGMLFGKRCDGDEKLKYFTYEDFDSLKAMKVEFADRNGTTLRGAVYAEAGIQQPEALIIFSHGMGGGHLSYMTEINTFAKSGFAVLAYDNAGTFDSDGESLGGFTGGPDALRAALAFVEKHPILGKMKKVLVGHSWGGYSVCQVLGDESTKVDCAVTFGAPESGHAVGSAVLGEKLEFLTPLVKLVFCIKEGNAAAIASSECVAKASDTPILLLHGKKDHIVAPRISAAEACKDLPNATSVLFDGRYHNVYQTTESEIYMNTTFAKIREVQKNKNASEEEINACYDIDYELITREDPAVMDFVTDFIRKNIQ